MKLVEIKRTVQDCSLGDFIQIDFQPRTVILKQNIVTLESARKGRYYHESNNEDGFLENVLNTKSCTKVLMCCKGDFKYQIFPSQIFNQIYGDKYSCGTSKQREK